MIIAKTPYRISFLGGGTDYPDWYTKHGGAALGATINKYCWISVKPPTPFGLKFKVIYAKVEECDVLEEIEHPAVRECLRYLGFEDKGVELHHSGDLPARSGMGSSSAFVVGLLHALHALRGDNVSAKTLATEACYIEQTILQETVGSQDQWLTSHGGLRRIDFKTGGQVSIKSVAHIPRDRMNELDTHLLLFFTGITRIASDVASGYIKQLHKDVSMMKHLVEMVEAGIDNIRNGNYFEFGKLLRESWQLKRSLPGVSNTDLDRQYTKAVEAGAIGGKILGAGGGGFLLLFVPPGHHYKVRSALSDLIEVPFKFDYFGSTVVYA